jgi:single-stranded DNA-binding protein
LQGTALLLSQVIKPYKEKITMQAFGNIATDPIRKISKSNAAKAYYEMRLCENHRVGHGNSGTVKNEATFYTVRIMKDVNPGLGKGDFVKVTGTLKVDSYLNREGKPSSMILIIAFEAVKLKGISELRAVHEAKLLAVPKEAFAA